MDLLLSIETIFAIIGTILALQQIYKKNTKKAIQLFSMIAIIPVSFFSGIRHFFYRGSIIKTSTPFFEIRCGAINLAIVISLIVAYLVSASMQSYASILLVYTIYLIVAAITTAKYISYKNTYIFIPMIIISIYFTIIAYQYQNKK